MNEASHTPKPGGSKGGRLLAVLGMLVLLGLLVAAAIFLHKPQTHPEGPLATSAAPGNTASGGHSAGGSTPAPAQPSTSAAPLGGATGGGQASANTGAQSDANPQASLADLIKALKDPSLPLDDRKKAIKALAQNGSPEAIAALKDALTSGSEELRAAVAEGLGDCTTPECTGILLGLLNDPSETIVKAAIKGLAQQGSPEAVDALAKMVYDPMRSTGVRVASIDGLGTISQPGAFQSLSQATSTLTDEDMVKAVLDAMGTRNIEETRTFFQNYVHNPGISSELRVAATEALAQAQGDPTAFLSSLATDADPDVRAAAAWAMSSTEATGNLAAQLVGLVQAENDSDVRLRLYQSLMNQENVDPSSVLALARNEKDPAARVEALNLLAKTLRTSPTPDLQSFFDQTAVPELKTAATKGETASERMSAINALIRANNPSSVLAAMQDIGQQATDPRVAQTANKYLNLFAGANGTPAPLASPERVSGR